MWVKCPASYCKWYTWLPACFKVPHNLLLSGNRCLFRWRHSGWGVKLTTHVHLEPRLTMGGAIPLVPPHSSRQAQVGCMSYCQVTTARQTAQLSYPKHYFIWRKAREPSLGTQRIFTTPEQSGFLAFSKNCNNCEDGLMLVRKKASNMWGSCRFKKGTTWHRYEHGKLKTDQRPQGPTAEKINIKIGTTLLKFRTQERSTLKTSRHTIHAAMCAAPNTNIVVYTKL